MPTFAGYLRTMAATAVCCASIIAASAADQIRIVRGGQEVEKQPSAAFTTNLVAIIESASVNSTSYAVKTNSWDEILRSKSFVHLKFATPKKLQVMLTQGVGPRQREEVAIDEILLELPETHFPLHLFAKTKGEVIALCKYSPVALKRIASEPALKLLAASPYKDLAALPE